MKIAQFAIAAYLIAAPVAVALAQATTLPAVEGNNKTENTLVRDGRAMNPAQPGATGRTVVPGSNSTVANDSAGTEAAKTGSTTNGAK